MRPRLIAFDMDGTLLGADGRVSRATSEAVEAVAATGTTVVVATGRSHWSALPLLDDLPSVRWVIGSNGATLFDRRADAVVVRRVMSARQVSAVTAAVRAEFPEAGFAWETADGVVAEAGFHRNREISRRAAGRPVPGRAAHWGDVALPPAGPVAKIMVAHPERVQVGWLDALRPLIPGELNAATSGADFVEIGAAEADKGVALAALCADLGIEAIDVAAFGDHTNDLGMLRWVGAGYAMANATDRVLDVTELRAPHHAEDGVAAVVAGWV